MAAKLREKDGFFWVVVHHRGKRKWKKIGKDKREAQAVVHKVNAQIALEKYSMKQESPATTVEAALTTWYTDYQPTFSASFSQVAEINIRLHLVPFFGPMKLGDVTEQHILQFISEKTKNAKKPLRATTLLNILSVLRRVMALAVDRGELSRTPCQHLGRMLAKVERHQSSEVEHVNAWSREEVANLLDVARSVEPRFYPLLMFLLSTGCRKGEALALKWEDVNFEESRILVRRALVRGQLGTPKSGRARFVVMSPALSGVLIDLLEVRHRATLTGQWKETPEIVFSDIARVA